MKKSIFITLVFLLVLYGCTTNYSSRARRDISFINYNDLLFPARLPNHYVELFFEGKPTEEYISIGRIDGFIGNPEDVNPLLKERARQVGGDAVMDIKITYETKDVTSSFAVGHTYGRRNWYHHGTYEPYYDTIETYKVSGTVIKYATKRAEVVGKK